MEAEGCDSSSVWCVLQLALCRDVYGVLLFCPCCHRAPCFVRLAPKKRQSKLDDLVDEEKTILQRQGVSYNSQAVTRLFLSAAAFLLLPSDIGGTCGRIGASIFAPGVITPSRCMQEFLLAWSFQPFLTTCLILARWPSWQRGWQRGRCIVVLSRERKPRPMKIRRWFLCCFVSSGPRADSAAHAAVSRQHNTHPLMVGGDGLPWQHATG